MKSQGVTVNILKTLKSQSGFTLLELVLSIVIAGAIFGIAAETMKSQADTYSFIANRKTSIADIRFAMSRMNDELLHLDSDDFVDISATKLDFVNQSGQQTNFRTVQNGDTLTLYYGNDILLPRVTDFSIEYQDGSGTPIVADADQIENVRRIKLSVTTDPVSNEGGITLSTTVIPRSFIGYTNYQ